MDEAQIRRAESLLFFRRWIKNPRQLGTLAPISLKLAMLAAKAAVASYKPGTPIVEIGAGTGRLTRALLKEGVISQDLTVVELDGQMCDFLRQTLPHIHVIKGDACYLNALVPTGQVGKVGVVVSAIPLMYLKEEMRQSIIKAAFAVLKPGAEIIHVTYNNRSPLRFWPDIRQSRAATAWFNVPPGFVWRFQR